MGQTADQLRQEIDRKRDDAAQKIDAIEVRVGDTVQQVKDSFDLRKQIEERPLLALGAALVGGFVLGGLVGGGDDHGRGRGDGLFRYDADAISGRGISGGTEAQWSPSSQGGTISGLRSAVKSSGLEDTISNMAAAFLGSVTERVRSAVDESFPGFADKFSTAQQTEGDFSAKRQAAQTSGSQSAPSDPTDRSAPYYGTGGVQQTGASG